MLIRLYFLKMALHVYTPPSVGVLWEMNDEQLDT